MTTNKPQQVECICAKCGLHFFVSKSRYDSQMRNFGAPPKYCSVECKDSDRNKLSFEERLATAEKFGKYNLKDFSQWFMKKNVSRSYVFSTVNLLHTFVSNGYNLEDIVGLNDVDDILRTFVKNKSSRGLARHRSAWRTFCWYAQENGVKKIITGVRK